MENIFVSIRIRPKEQPSQLSEENEKDKLKSTSLLSNSWKLEGNSIINVKSKDIFSYDKVFDDQTETIDIFNNSIKNLLNQFLNGINLSIFAYGQTSTGKTYTMRGCDTCPGIIPLSLNYIFLNSSCREMRINEMRVSYLEIYNENVNDLLDTSKKNLEIREGKKGIYVENLTEIRVDTPDIAFNLVKQGDSNKIIAETKLNDKSSRSHCIFKISIDLEDSNGKKYTSTLNLIDLAGSENATKTKTEGVRLKEGSNINKSLLALANVIQKLSSNTKSSYISYRDSKLTRFLQPCLSGNFKTAIICTISIKPNSYSETLNTLLFAARAKNIKTSIKVNEVLVDEKDRISIENLELKYKIKRLEDKINFSARKTIYESASKSNKPEKEMSNSKSKLRSSNKKVDLSLLEQEVNMLKSYYLLTNKKENLYSSSSNYIQPLPFNLQSTKKEKDDLYINDNQMSMFKSNEKQKMSMNMNNFHNQNYSHNLTQSQMKFPHATNSLFPNEVFSSPYINKFSYSNYQGLNQNQNQLFDSEIELIELRKQIKDMKQHFLEAIEKKNSYINTIKEGNERMRHDLEENYLKIRMENERMKEEAVSKDCEMRGLLMKLNQSEKQLGYLKEEITQLKSSEYNSSIENEINSQNERISILEKEILIYKKLNDEMMIENKKYKEKNSQLQKNNETLYTENFSNKTQIDIANKNIEALKIEISQLKNNIESYKSEIGLLQAKILQKKYEVNEMKQENNKILKKNFNLEYETKIKTLNTIKSSLENEIQVKDSIIKDLEKRVDELNMGEESKIESICYEKCLKDGNESSNGRVDLNNENDFLKKKREISE